MRPRSPSPTPGSSSASRRGEGGRRECPLQLKSVRLIESVGEILVVFALLRSAELLDRRQLILGEVEFTLSDIGLAKILAHLRIVRVESDRLQIVAYPFLRPPKFAGRIAAIVEGARGIRVVQEVEHVDRLLKALRLGQCEGIFGQV